MCTTKYTEISAQHFPKTNKKFSDLAVGVGNSFGWVTVLEDIVWYVVLNF